MAIDWFPQDYQSSRRWFREAVARVRVYWPEAHLESFCLPGEEDLTIDWIRAEALEQPEKLLILTTGEHGIEAFTGVAVLASFLDEWLPRLEARSIGLCLVHAINPWGMQHRRRVNRNNVDLNRNFLLEWAQPGPRVVPENPGYARLDSFLNRPIPLKSLGLDQLAFYLGLANSLRREGVATLRSAVLLGQYHFPQGIYYGGSELQPETQVMLDLYRHSLAAYPQVLHLDMHTGYGPRQTMLLVHSALEARSSAEIAAQCHYPHIVKADPQEFYSIQGDMVDCLYRLAQLEAPGTRLYSAAFEFGTLGASTLDGLRSLQAMVFENRAFWHGAPPAAFRQANLDFDALFIPPDLEWRRQAIESARRAFEGIFHMEGLWAGDTPKQMEPLPSGL